MTTLSDDPLWFKDAIIYELRVRSFNDSNADGIGDFPGLTQKLDYLHDLGVTALWILPFYPSPGRDDGYDISDYTDVNPDYGRLEDFKEFLDAAHARGLRVITELVINHTSDQHPWFQRARRSPAGTSQRDFYVWSETAERFREARIIFKDFEASNWSWDPLAKAYYWHRFYSHQPDLNFRNPEVQRAVFAVCDFWLDLGVDGMRLDAVPYLYEEEGTNCENLPETHAFLKALRAHVDSKYQNRMFLAEANQWPEDAAAYFGTGDECQMNFHFPIMPRIFMAIHREDRFPIMDILAQTPPIPENCQWALFLRNHDELTLEMVTDEERDYMYQAFADDPQMRINLGIRRRLAPLLENDRPNIELMNALLFSLPGTPVVYYGDELGMGDNVYLGDRNGVRTPMQWSGDRNAGFSRANPQRLMLPVIIDPEYHYESINVEAQHDNPHSLLWWTRRMVALRKRYRVFGRGTIEFLQPENPRVLAFLRQLDRELVLVVANLSRTVQYVDLDLSAFRGLTPVEMMGRVRFPPIGEGPFRLTLGGHGFYWLSLERTAATAQIARVASYQPLSVEFDGPAERLLDFEERDLLAGLLPNYLQAQHWFRGGLPGRVSVLDVVPLGVESDPDLHLVPVEASFPDRGPDRYVLFLTLRAGAALAELRGRSPWAIVGNVRTLGATPGELAIVDAIADPPAGKGLLQWLAEEHRVRVRGGELRVEAVAPLPAPPELLEPRHPRVQHETDAMVFGDQILLKLERRIDDGIPPDLEISRWLSGKPGMPTAPLLRSLVFHPRRGPDVAIAALFKYVPHEGDGWTLVRGELSRFFERVLTRPREVPVPSVTWSVEDPGLHELPAPVAENVGTFLQIARSLGTRIGQLHLALTASQPPGPPDPAMAPEPYSVLDQRSIYQSMRNVAGTSLRALRRALPVLSEEERVLGRRLLERQNDVYACFQPLLGHRLTALRSRVHGDLTLRRLLYDGNEFTVIDFDGDRRKPLTERRRKWSPLRDVTSLLVSLHRAVIVSVADEAMVRPPDRERALEWADLWLAGVWSAVLSGYLDVAKEGGWLPRTPDEMRLLFRTFLLENALDDLGDDLERGGPGIEASLRLLLRLVPAASS